MAREPRTSPDDEESGTPNRGPQPPRLSITLPVDVRKKIRLAAAVADLSEPDWARAIIAKAADNTVKKYFPDLA